MPDYYDFVPDPNEPHGFKVTFPPKYKIVGKIAEKPISEEFLEEDMASFPPSIRNRKIGICVGCQKEITENDKREKERPYVLYAYGKRSANLLSEVVCQNCLPKFAKCKGCGRTFRGDELQLEHCYHCVDEAPTRYIRNYHFKVENALKMKGQGEREAKIDELFFGVELELDSSRKGLDTLIVLSTLGEGEDTIGILKKDSTVKTGFEIVSIPATMGYHYIMWDKFFEKLPVTCKPLRSCGMHVHVSRSRLSELQIAKILVFLHNPDNRHFITLCAGRPSSYHNDFEKPKTFGDVRKKIDPDTGKLVDRHTALNLNNDNTIEFRLFRSTRDKRIFLKNIEFCRALVKFTDWAHNSIEDSRNYRKFMEFVFKYRKEYPYLTLYFETSPFSTLRS